MSVGRDIWWLLVFSVLSSCAEATLDRADAGGGETDAWLGIEDAGAPDACVPTGDETCDGTDEDCDGEIDEGFDVGDACDSDDADECLDDITTCSEDGLDIVCTDSGPERVELCNGVDDDCRVDTLDGSADPNVNSSCDGADSDLCAEGTYFCSGGALICSDNTGSTADICNSLDDDCDPSSADGSEDSRVGVLCDGSDGDLCKEGTMNCAGGVVTCGDLSTTTVDLCNGLDDDCDPSSADGSEDPQNGLGCDGADSDLCIEGVNSCQGGVLSCSDTTGSTIDLCNGLDDDCDVTSADGDEDSLVGVACDGADTDLCEEGNTQCIAAAIGCSDSSGDSVEVCNGQDDDCDGQIDEGFPSDTNPLCAEAVLLGSVSGDLGPDILAASEFNERWYRVTISENSFTTSSYLSATITLDSPTNMDFDLYVYCESCAGGQAGSSTNSSGLRDTVGIRRNDGAGNESFDILIEVRFSSASICSTWDLTITSDTAVAVETCPAP